MDPSSDKMKMPASELKQNFEMIRGIMADNQKITAEVLEQFEYILDNEVKNGCEDLIIASLHVTRHALKSAKLTEVIWKSMDHLWENMKGSYECEFQSWA